MSRVQWRGGALLGPVPPALVTCGSGDTANILTVAWTGILSTRPPKTYVSVRPCRHSYRLIKESGEFVIHLCPSSLVRAADFCGMYTGAKVDKFARTGLTPVPSSRVGSPTIAECPVALECRVTQVIPLGTHDMFMADIVAVTVRDDLLDEAGKLHLERAELAAFAHGDYYALGRHLGSFGFSAVRRHKSPKKTAREKEKKA